MSIYINDSTRGSIRNYIRLQQEAGQVKATTLWVNEVKGSLMGEKAKILLMQFMNVPLTLVNFL